MSDCLCAANLCVCAVSEICVHAHSLEGTVVPDQSYSTLVHKTLGLLFDLIATFLYECSFSRSPRHKEVNDDLYLHGMINNKYFFDIF